MESSGTLPLSASALGEGEAPKSADMVTGWMGIPSDGNPVNTHPSNAPRSSDCDCPPRSAGVIGLVII